MRVILKVGHYKRTILIIVELNNIRRRRKMSCGWFINIRCNKFADPTVLIVSFTTTVLLLTTNS